MFNIPSSEGSPSLQDPQSALTNEVANRTESSSKMSTTTAKSVNINEVKGECKSIGILLHGLYVLCFAACNRSFDIPAGDLPACAETFCCYWFPGSGGNSLIRFINVWAGHSKPCACCRFIAKLKRYFFKTYFLVIVFFGDRTSVV